MVGPEAKPLLKPLRQGRRYVARIPFVMADRRRNDPVKDVLPYRVSAAASASVTPDRSFSTRPAPVKSSPPV